jgi:hypothetical protein
MGCRILKQLSKQAAQLAYRAAWEQYLLTEDDQKRRQLEQMMDHYQPDCVDSRGPGPEWAAFIETLSGFVDFWNRWRKIAAENIK